MTSPPGADDLRPLYDTVLAPRLAALERERLALRRAIANQAEHFDMLADQADYYDRFAHWDGSDEAYEEYRDAKVATTLTRKAPSIMGRPRIANRAHHPNAVSNAAVLRGV